MKLLCLLLIASCSSYFPPVRGQYTLTSLKNFIISNMYVNPSNLEKNNTDILINYDVIVRNVDKTAHPINLKESVIRIADKSYPMRCHRYKHLDEEFSLEAGAHTRIICVARLDIRKFARSDYQSSIQIPLDQDLAKFEYLLRAEDFK